MIKKTATGFVAGAVMAMTGQAAMADGHGEITVGVLPRMANAVPGSQSIRRI